MRNTMYLRSFKVTAMAITTMVHVRVDEDIKAKATETLTAMGLSVSDAVRVFLMHVVADQQLPLRSRCQTPKGAPRWQRPMR